MKSTKTEIRILPLPKVAGKAAIWFEEFEKETTPESGIDSSANINSDVINFKQYLIANKSLYADVLQKLEIISNADCRTPNSY